MLTITIPAMENFNEATSEFIDLPEIKLELEHSLVSLSKWEAEYKKPFLTKEPKSTEEAIGYIRAMTLTKDVPVGAYQRLSPENFKEINEYIEDRMTATWFSDSGQSKKPNRDVLTAEVLYYLLSANEIDFEVQHWHLHRLITLVEVHAKKNAPPGKKMSPRELAARNREINERRRAELNTNG